MEAPDWTAPFSAKWSLVTPQHRDRVGDAPASGPSDKYPVVSIIRLEGIGEVEMPANFANLSPDQQQETVA